MIVNLFLNLVYGLVYIVLLPVRILPVATLPDEITHAISAISNNLAGLNTILPVGSFLAILGLVLTIEGFIFLWNGINWILRRIPTQS